ncbi:MAG: hypothetical protein KJ056_13825, partial [Acidimicrobiia bacterium]|nr:hypothetical protein [Acidimicrobiia bacterium]
TEETILQNGVRHRLFATLILCCTGLDLLAKCARGKPPKNELRKHYEAFVVDYCLLSPAEAKHLYDFRNSLVHAFGLPEEKGGVRFGIRHDPPGKTKHLFSTRAGRTAISVHLLYKTFLDTAHRLHDVLRAPTTGPLRDTFEKTFDWCGTIGIQPARRKRKGSTRRAQDSARVQFHAVRNQTARPGRR